MEFIFSILILVGVLFGITVVVKNNLIRSKNNVEKAASNIDVYLQKRFDLMENLFMEVERGLDHEEYIYKEVAAMRSNFNGVKNNYDGASAQSIVCADKAVKEISRGFSAVVENYPQVKGMDLVSKMMDENSKLERDVASARRSYNSNVTSYKNSVMMFPSSIFAGQLGFTSNDFELYEADKEARVRPKPMYEQKYRDKYATNNETNKQDEE